MRSLIWRWWAFAKKRQIKNHAKLTSYTVSEQEPVDTVNSEKIALVYFFAFFFLEFSLGRKIKNSQWLVLSLWHSMLRPIRKVKKRKNWF